MCDKNLPSAIPVIINGFSRSFSFPANGHSALNCWLSPILPPNSFDGNHSLRCCNSSEMADGDIEHHEAAVKQNFINAVLFPVDSDQLTLFDWREQGYSRVEIENHRHSIRGWSVNSSEERGSAVSSDDKVWIYCCDRSKPADHQCPIAQSYMDVVMAGCLEYGDKFARLFLDTTEFPSSSESDEPFHWWIDDRHGEREIYRRPLRNQFQSAEMLCQMYRTIDDRLAGQLRWFLPNRRRRFFL